ncbi:MAG: sulfatase-like hydrolase/transferase, partial [Lachnospiraceae bacterium]|nr:sulfatase-like hydrolase/transferase [Lachnospiraceae bacterium]
EMTPTWPESDLEMMEKTVPEYVNDEPFHTYYMTVSGHLYYTFEGNYMSYKNQDLVKDLSYDVSSRAYIACNIELDRALESLIKQLSDAGVLERTVIALSADHYPYGLDKSSIDNLAGHTVEENFELYKEVFILWNSEIKEPITVDKAACSMDIVPTVSNLFNLPFDSRLFMGQDILSDESTGFVVFANRSFISDKVKYNSITKQAEVLTEEPLPDDYIKNTVKYINNMFTYSAKIIEKDYYKFFK